LPDQPHLLFVSPPDGQLRIRNRLFPRTLLNPQLGIAADEEAKADPASLSAIALFHALKGVSEYVVRYPVALEDSLIRIELPMDAKIDPALRVLIFRVLERRE